MKLPKIVKDGATLISGNMWAQIIAFVAYLVLTRLYTPEDFAIFNIFYSYIEVLIILSTCKYEMSIVVSDTDREATAAARLALRMNTLFSLALLTLLLVLYLLPIHMNMPAQVALLIPFMVFFCGTTRVYTGLFNRFKGFGQIALSEVITSTSGVILKILMAFPALLHQLGLPLGTVLGKAAGNLNYLFRLKKLNLPKDISRKERREAAKKHRNFPLYNMPKELLSSFSFNLPFLWLAHYFDNDPAIGLFGLAVTFTFRPVNILNVAFEKLLYIRTAEKVRANQKVFGDISKFMLYLNLASLPLFAIAFLFAEPLFGLFFGGKWVGTGYYVRCLIPWLFIALSSTSLSFLANVFSKQKIELYFHIVLLLLRASTMIYGIMAHSFASAILWFSMVSAAVCMAVLIWYLSLAYRHDRQVG